MIDFTKSRPVLRVALVLGLLLVQAMAHSEDHDSDDATKTPAPKKVRSEASISRAEAAIQRAERLTRLKPEDATAWSDLGNAWMQKSRDHANGVGHSRAEAAFETALSKDASHVSALVGMAWVCNTRHQFDDGTRWAKKALELDPKQPDAYALLGDAAVELGDYESAFEHFQTCLDLRPDLSAYSRSAHLLFLTGDLRRAQALMLQAIRAGGPYPENVAWCQAQLALMQFQSGSLLVAEKTLQKALRAAPENPQVLAVAGKIAIARKDYAAAIRNLEPATRSSHAHAPLVDLELAYTLAGDSENARTTAARIEALHRSHSHDADHDHSHPHADSDHDEHDRDHDHPHEHAHAPGDAHWARYLADHDRDLDVALREAEDAYRTFKNVHVTDTLAWCYYKKGRHADAQKAVRKALKWKTPDASILYHAGMIEAKLGDLAAAKKYLYQALSLNPNFHPIEAAKAAETLASLGGTKASSPDRSEVRPPS